MSESRPPYLRVGIYSLLDNPGLVAVKLTRSFTTGSLALMDRSGRISEHFGEAPFFAILDVDLETQDVSR